MKAKLVREVIIKMSLKEADILRKIIGRTSPVDRCQLFKYDITECGKYDIFSSIFDALQEVNYDKN